MDTENVGYTHPLLRISDDELAYHGQACVHVYMYSISHKREAIEVVSFNYESVKNVTI